MASKLMASLSWRVAWPDPASAQVGEHRPVAVSLVARQVLGFCSWPASRIGQADSLQGLLEHRHLMPLPGRERKAERQAGAIAHQVDLAAEPASREAKRMVVRLLRILFLRAPAAERLARTEVLSMHHRSRSISPSAFSLSRSRSRILSNNPSWRHRVRRS